MLQWPKKIIRFIKKLKNKIQSLEEENHLLNERIKDLEKRLAYYENAHTPPSARKLPKKKKQDTKKSSKTGKQGAPKGHRGATRPKPEPDETIDVIADECERCGSRNVQDLDEMKKCIIEDFLRPQEIEINQYNQHKMKCMDCGHEFISKHPDCPQKGNFGISLLVHVTMLKFHLRGVLRKIQDFLFFENDGYASMTPL